MDIRADLWQSIFGKAFSAEDVRNYDPAFPINTGYIIFDESGWHGESEVAGAEKNDIAVRKSNSAYFVSGAYARVTLAAKRQTIASRWR